MNIIMKEFGSTLLPVRLCFSIWAQDFGAPLHDERVKGSMENGELDACKWRVGDFGVKTG